MASKYFLLNENQVQLQKEDILEIEAQKVERAARGIASLSAIKNEVRSRTINLHHVDKKVVILADREQKNYYTFSNGTVIRMERDYNNLDRSYTQQTLGTVISGNGIPDGALILFHFNCLSEHNKIYNHSPISGVEFDSGIEVYSIPESLCYLWKMPGEEKWNTFDGFDLAERVFVPYNGFIQGIEPKQLKDTLYVLTGEYKGLVVKTLAACDPVLHFRNEKGVDERIIRFRPNEIPSEQREAEALAILHDETEKVNSGEYLVGIDTKTAKPIFEPEDNI